MQCPCNPLRKFDICCQPLILGKDNAKTAEQLMRSRYSAYVVADINYLMNSHYPQTRPTKERKSILKWAKSVQWLGLQIISMKKGELHDNEGYVEFKALFMTDSKVESIHENSYFMKENNKWYYKSGTHK